MKIYGNVQGVFFRAQAVVRARELGLAGWAKNENDGIVQIVAEGSEKQLKNLIGWCYNGIKFAKVDRVDVRWEEMRGEFKSFEIKYD